MIGFEVAQFLQVNPRFVRNGMLDFVLFDEQLVSFLKLLVNNFDQAIVPYGV